MSTAPAHPIDDIKPGLNYPSYVEVTEPPGGPVKVVKFLLQAYTVGMYCAVYFDGLGPHQAGHHKPAAFVRGLVKDLRKALARGATVEIGPLRALPAEPQHVSTPIPA